MRQKWPQKPPLGTPINWSHPSAKGRVGDWIFNEGGGDLVNDLSGNGNHGTLNGMAFPPTAVSGWNAGRRGTGLKFDGTDDYVDCGNDASLDIADEITIEAWVISENWGSPAENHQVTRKEGVWTFGIGLAGRVGFYLNNGSWHGSWTFGTNALSTSNWHHIVGIREGNTMKVFIDGIQDAHTDTITGNLTTNTNHVAIGASITATEKWYGQIDQVRIYNRALVAKEIIDIYTDHFGMFERTKWGLLVPTSVPSGLSIPVAMHNYRRLRA